MPCHVHDTNNNDMQIKHDIDKNGFMAPLHGTPATASGSSVTSVAYQHVACEREKETLRQHALAFLIQSSRSLPQRLSKIPLRARTLRASIYMHMFILVSSHVRVCLHQSIDQQLTKQFCVGMASTFITHEGKTNWMVVWGHCVVVLGTDTHTHTHTHTYLK